MQLTLKVYSAPGCWPCVQLKRYLDERGIEYEVVDVLRSEGARERLAKEGLSVVPVVERNGEIVQVGFNGGKGLEKILSP